MTQVDLGLVRRRAERVLAARPVTEVSYLARDAVALADEVAVLRALVDDLESAVLLADQERRLAVEGADRLRRDAVGLRCGLVAIELFARKLRDRG